MTVGVFFAFLFEEERDADTEGVAKIVNRIGHDGGATSKDSTNEFVDRESEIEQKRYKNIARGLMGLV